MSNALVPAVYQLDGDGLVRRDRKGAAAAARIAAAYRELAARGEPHGPPGCDAAAAHALEHWGER